MVRVPLVVSASCAAASVTVCGVFQLLGVKVSVAPEEMVMSVSPLPAAEVTVTFSSGWAARRTVYVAVLPSGTVTDVGVTISDCSWVASSSISLASTVAGVTPGPPTVKTAVPETASASCAAARVTVCGVSQLLGVNVSEAPEATLRSESPLVLVVFTVTFEEGADDRRAVKVAVPPSGTATELAEVMTAGVSVLGSPQVVPLMANEVGAGLLPVQEPLKPMLVLAPVARLPFHSMFWAVTRVPDWLQVALQPCS